MKKILVTHIPKGSVATSKVRDSETTRLADIMTWASENLRGTLWWSETKFRDIKSNGSVYYNCYDSRQKHFKDDYKLYQFWFSRKADAAMFIIFWGMYVDEVI